MSIYAYIYLFLYIFINEILHLMDNIFALLIFRSLDNHVNCSAPDSFYKLYIYIQRLWGF